MSPESISEMVDRETEPDDDDTTTPDDDDTGDDNGDDTPDVDPDSAPAQLAEQDWDKIARTMERESLRHEKRVAEILGDAIADVDVCPCCDFPGFVYPFHPGTDAGEAKRAAVAAYMGDAEPDYKTDSDAQACAKCDGWGVVLSGSRKVETRTIPCDKCGATGWLRKVGQYAQQPPYQPIEGEIVGGSVNVNGQGAPDAWGRPAGHADYGRAPMFNPATGAFGWLVVSGRRTEIPHHTHAQVEGYLSDALAIVERLELNDELYPLAFSKAVDLLAAKNITVEQVSPFGGLGVHPGRLGT